MNKQILHQSIALLARREHSLKELQQKLRTKGHEKEDIEPVLAFLEAENYQSDVRAAESIFRNRVSRGYGWRYIEQELTQKGITAIITRTVKAEQEVDWYQLAADSYLKKYGNKGIADQKDKAKRMRFLQSRGFSFDEINTVLKTDYYDL